jgi:lipoyl(octanoyl) transferase
MEYLYSNIKVCNFAPLLFIQMNKKIQLQDLGNKDYKDTWDYQEELFKAIVDLKIQNRRE